MDTTENEESGFTFLFNRLILSKKKKKNMDGTQIFHGAHNWILNPDLFHSFWNKEFGISYQLRYF